MNQNTITEKVSCTGTGLHTGVPVQLSVYPARAGTGIVFVRTDLGDPVEIPARVARVVSSSFSTSLGRAGVTLSTVEHLLAAFYALGSDNARVEVDAAAGFEQDVRCLFVAHGHGFAQLLIGHVVQQDRVGFVA